MHYKHSFNEPYGWSAPGVEKPQTEAAMTAFAKSSQLGGWCRPRIWLMDPVV